MRLHRIMGLLAAACCFGGGIVRDAPLLIFFNPPSVVIAVVGPIGVLAVIHGRRASGLFWAFVDWLRGAEDPSMKPEAHAQLATMAREFGQCAMVMGALGMQIGHIQMLQNMADPTAIGPALAVSLLTPFYGVLAHAFIAVPLSHHHLQRADAPAEVMERRGPGGYLLGLMALSFGSGAFFVLPTMASF